MFRPQEASKYFLNAEDPIYRYLDSGFLLLSTQKFDMKGEIVKLWINMLSSMLRITPIYA